MTMAVLQHVPFEGPAAIADWAAARGIELAVTHLYRGDPLPLLSDFAMLAVMGGPNFQTTAAKRRLSKLANVIGTGRILTRDVCGLIFGQMGVSKFSLSHPIFGQIGLVLFPSCSFAITRKPLRNMVGATDYASRSFVHISSKSSHPAPDRERLRNNRRSLRQNVLQPPAALVERQRA